MKPGPHHFEKTKCNLSPAQAVLGIPEIVANILHYYPRYELRGQNNLVTVSTVWHEAMKQCHLQDEPTFEKLIADCLKCPEGVIHILRDNTLLPYLSEEQILRLISCHSEFAIYLLENDFIYFDQKDCLISENLLVLTKHHSQVAMHLITSPKWFEKISYNIYAFGCQHPEIAQYILDNNMGTDDHLYDRKRELNKLAESSVIIARRLCNEPATFEDLTEPNLKGPKFLYKHLELLIETGKANDFLPPEINTPEDFINHFEALCDLGLTPKGVEALGDYHAEIAMKVLQSETLEKKYLEIGTPFDWDGNHEAVAIYSLKTRKNLGASMVKYLCKTHPAAVEYVFNTPDLRNVICQHFFNNDFLSYSILPLDKIAMHILKAPIFSEKLYDRALKNLGVCNPEAAKFILTTKELYTKLSKNNLQLICNKYPHIIRKILNTQSLRELVNPAHLEILEALSHGFIMKPFAIEISRQAKRWNLQTNKSSEEMDVDAFAKFTLKK